MALVDGRLFSANVGDSSTLMSISDVQEEGVSTMVPSHCTIRLCDLGSAHLHQQEAGGGFSMEKAFIADAQANFSGSKEQIEAAETHLNQLLSEYMSGDAGSDAGSRLTQRGETLPVEPTSSFVVTADHSPEAHTEVTLCSPDPFHKTNLYDILGHLQFERLRRTRPKPSDPKCPDLMMVYDSPTTSGSKASCPRIFEHEALESAPPNSAPRITNKGKYYKNVRSEWASLVATPATARFQVSPPPHGLIEVIITPPYTF